MLQNIKELYGHTLAALDGGIGQVKDFYFDDKIWVVRYLVVETGSWLPGRLVLLSPHAFGKWDRYEKTLQIKLSKKQIQNSPSIESHKPVSRQYEMEYYSYYGLPAYWNGGAMWGAGGYPVALPPSKEEMEVSVLSHLREDRHLQSARSITGYQIQTADEMIGRVSGLNVDDRSWAIREIVGETGHWFSGKEILLSPAKVERISYEESKVFVNLTSAELLQIKDKEVVKIGAGTQEEEDSMAEPGQI